MTTRRAMTVGSATLDIFMQRPNAHEVRRVSHPVASLVIAEGSKINVEDIHITFGGGGLNSAAALYRQGWDVVPCFVRGHDNVGAMIIEEVSSYGIPTDYHTVLPGRATGLSTIIPSPLGNSSLLVYRGANNFLTMDHIPRDLMGEVDLLFCGSLAGNSGKLLPQLTRSMRSICPFIASGLNRYQAQEWVTLRDALPYLDVVCCNEREARTLCERLVSEKLLRYYPHEPELHRQSGDEHILPQLLRPWVRIDQRNYYLIEYARFILQHGPSMVVVTNGAEGAYVITREHVFFQSIHNVTVANTVGAGDAFAATFSSCIAQGNNIPEALLRGLVNVVAVLHAQDSHDGLLMREELSSSLYIRCINDVQQFFYAT